MRDVGYDIIERYVSDGAVHLLEEFFGARVELSPYFSIILVENRQGSLELR
jgi:hypothetical protein